MASILKSLKVLSDPTRVRLLLLLREQELSVAELQDILGMGQSRISNQLSQLREAGLVLGRRSGRKTLYCLSESAAASGGGALMQVVADAGEEIAEVAHDRVALGLALKRRSDRAREYFNQLAGKFGRSYVPGRSWKGLAEALLKLMPPCTVADLGAGEGTFSQLLAGKAEKVIAIDYSENMVEYGTKIARENGFKNLEYRHGDIEDVPIEDGEVDIAFFSQALHHANRPPQAMAEAHRILKPGGRIVVLDLLNHQFEDARELYADVWLGFSELDMHDLMEKAGFRGVEVAVVDREEEPPHFQTLLAVGEK